jgi:hypothetical protein
MPDGAGGRGTAVSLRRQHVGDVRCWTSEGQGKEPERLDLHRERERRIWAHMAGLEDRLALISERVTSYSGHLAAGTATDLVGRPEHVRRGSVPC